MAAVVVVDDGCAVPAVRQHSNKAPKPAQPQEQGAERGRRIQRWGAVEPREGDEAERDTALGFKQTHRLSRSLHRRLNVDVGEELPAR